MFTDGAKLEKSAKIDCDMMELEGYGDYKYSTYIILSESDIELFKTKKISKFRLYIYDNELTDKQANNFRTIFNCIIDK